MGNMFGKCKKPCSPASVAADQCPRTPATTTIGISGRGYNLLLFYSQRGILYYSTPREGSFTILLPERDPLLFYSQRGILYYSPPPRAFLDTSLPAATANAEGECNCWQSSHATGMGFWNLE